MQRRFGKDVVDLLDCFPAIGAKVVAMCLCSPAVKADTVVKAVNFAHAGQEAQNSQIIVQGGKE